MGNGGKITSFVYNQQLITFMKSRHGPSGCLLPLCVCLLVSLLFYCGWKWKGRVFDEQGVDLAAWI